MKWSCEICGQYVAKKDRHNKSYCSKNCYLKSCRRKCYVCGQEFFAAPKTKRYCDNCIGECGKHTYKTNLKQKTCTKCGASFIGTAKRRICEHCPHHTNETVHRPVVCNRCNKILEYEYVKQTGKNLPQRLGGLCSECTEASRQRLCELNKLRRNTATPRKRKNYYKPISEEQKAINRQRASQRMKTKNPMFNKNTRKKVSQTFKQKLESGEITYKSGTDHHLWKGNRGFLSTCRTRLYPVWTIRVMERDGFRCTLCGKGGSLQVHHIVPFRNIVSKIFKSHNIKHADEIDVNSDLAEQIILEIIASHELSDGITVCPQCHGQIDSRYRRKHED